MIILGKLLVSFEDLEGYVTYVFENSNSINEFDKYLMCTRCPNWNHEPVLVGQIGFIHTEEHKAGVDTWYDANNDSQNKYRCNMVQFMKFVPFNKSDNDNNTITL